MSLVPHDSCRGVQHALPMPHDASSALPKIAAFTFLVRDAADFLEANGRAVSSIGRTHFREHRLFYVENDSADGTRAILRRLERELPLSGVMLNVSAERSTALCRRGRSDARGAALLARLRDALSLRSRGRRGTSSSASTSTSSASRPTTLCGRSRWRGRRRRRLRHVGVRQPRRRHAVRPGRGAAEGGAALDLARLPHLGPQRLLRLRRLLRRAAAPRARAVRRRAAAAGRRRRHHDRARELPSRSTPPAPARSSSTRASSRSTSGATDIFGRASAPPTPRPRGRGRRGERPRGVC